MDNTFIETIRYQNGRFHLLDLHQQRMEATIKETFGNAVKIPPLESSLPLPPHSLKDKTLKYRVTYSTFIHKIEFESYTPRLIKSLKIVESDSSLDYHLKKSDRTPLTALAALKGDCDDVLIIRDGLITDTSYTNIVFRGYAGYYTPSTPLLRGVMRSQLLRYGLITEHDLHITDLLPSNPLGLTEAYLINAMLPLYSSPPIPLTTIRLP